MALMDQFLLQSPEILIRFRQKWELSPCSIRDIWSFLEMTEQSNHAHLLVDLVGEHLRLSWRDGIRVCLEAYVQEFGKDYPEFRSLLGVPAALVEAEFAARHAFLTGDAPSLESYLQRFPGRNEVLDLLRRRELDGGRYARVEILGKGGMGRVSLAFDRHLHRHVAIKEPLPVYAEHAEIRHRLLNEACITAGLEHPSIVTVHEAWPGDKSRSEANGTRILDREHDGPFYVMRNVPGETLHQRIRDFHAPKRVAVSDQLRFNQLLDAFVDICNAVAYAHSRGIVHRDLKPENVRLGDFGETIVVDWGLAKSLHGKSATDTIRWATSPTGSALHETAAVDVVSSPDATEPAGTLAYMAPEQARGWGSTSSDIFGLGAILYAILVGRAPYEVPTTSDRSRLLEKVKAGDYTPPRQRAKQVPRPLEAICLKAMAIESQDRYSTAKELAEDVQRWLADEPVGAYADPVSVRLGRFARKHRPLVATAATVLIGATFALAVGLYLVNTQRHVVEIARQGETAQRIEAQKQSRLARQNETEAKDRNNETTAVLDFVVERVLALARPDGLAGGLGPDVSLRTAVEAAVPFLDSSFQNKPLIEARLRDTLGSSFFYLGDTRAAETQYRRARDLYLVNRGPDHSDTLASANNLALCYCNLDRPHEAAKMLEEIVAQATKINGRDHSDTLSMMHNLAKTYSVLGRYAEALGLLEETLAIMKVKVGAEDPNTFLCMSKLARSYADVGRNADALALCNETLALQTARLGHDHPDTLITCGIVGGIYFRLGQTDAALKLREETLARKRVKFGPAHPVTAFAMADLAVSYAALGRHGEALTLREKSLELLQGKLGPDIPSTATCMSELASSYYAAGRHSEALKLREESLSIRKTKLGADHPHTLVSMNDLADSYAALGRQSEAIQLREECLAMRIVKCGADDPQTLANMSELAQDYVIMNRPADALKLREQSLAIRKAKLGADHPHTLVSMNDLANSYAAVGRQNEALQLRKETLARQTKEIGPDHPHTLVSMNNLAISYSAMGRHADALALHKDTLDRRKRTLGPDHRDTLISMEMLAGVYQTMGRPDLALPLFQESLAVQRMKLGPDNAETLRNMNQVAWLSFCDHQPDAALTLFAECLERRERAEPDLWTTFNTQSMLGEVLLSQQKYAEAEHLLLSGYEGLKVRQAVVPTQSAFMITLALDRLIHLYDAWGKPDEAAKWRAKLPVEARVRDGLERDYAWAILSGWPKF